MILSLFFHSLSLSLTFISLSPLFLNTLDLGVVQLSIGERANLFIPYHLAWGEKGFPGSSHFNL